MPRNSELENSAILTTARTRVTAVTGIRTMIRAGLGSQGADHGKRAASRQAHVLRSLLPSGGARCHTRRRDDAGACRARDLREDGATNGRYLVRKDGSDTHAEDTFLIEVQADSFRDTLATQGGRATTERRSRKCKHCLRRRYRLRHRSPSVLFERIIRYRHQPRRPRPRLLRRLRHDRRRRPQDGPPLDHGRAGRALPHPHHSAPEEGHRRRRSRAVSPRRRLEGRRRLPLLPLAPSLLEKDEWGNWVISKRVQRRHAGRGVCKLKGFTYAPERDALLAARPLDRDATSSTSPRRRLTHDAVRATSAKKSATNAYAAGLLHGVPRASADAFPNLTVKKIPKAVLHKCEWGQDDYSLKIENLPTADRRAGSRDCRRAARHRPKAQGAAADCRLFVRLTRRAQ